jgi:imidazolonepropionase-like amidohydrolase
MGKPGKIATLPPDVKAWLDRALVDNNFSDYDLLVALAKERGVDISRSGLHRYGKDFKDRLSSLKLATEQARAVVEAAPDDEGSVNEALMRLVQEHLFKMLLASEGKFDPAKIARAVAELGRASVVQKKWQTEVRARAEAAAANVEKIAKKGGLSGESVEALRREILGIAA